ncbi:hypothetical protein CY35_05G092000 [Sphagnum magellanicum]|nr:hypothetical protein CY35_05G092000 [Sphagnum magellanicum]
MYNQGRSGLSYWSPNINIVRDPRWGRTQETPGEDPKLTSTYAVYFVKGLQEGHYDGSQIHTAGGPKRLKVSACCKHFTAHDLDSWKGYDRNYFDAKVSLQDLEDTYNPPFKSCVKEGQSSSLMCSYNRLNGIPMCTHYELLTLTVRNIWGFNGYIVSDCDAVALIHEYIHYAPTPEDAVSYVLLAGMDLNCGTTVLYHAQAALDKGLIWEELINMHLRNLFSVRMRLGMFDGDPETLPFGSLGPSDVCTTGHQNLALEAAQQSIVLLKNARSTLPWNKTKKFKLAVIGPHGNATQEMLGNYEGIPCKFTSPLDGITALFGGNGQSVIYAPGCADATCRDGNLFPSAVTAASEADAVVLFVGLSQAQESEGRDRESLRLPGKQEELISTVLDAVNGRPVVLVILSGGPVDVSFANDDQRVGGILWAGYPGQAGGQAIAEIIFGDVNPGGRLALSWYHENYTQMDMSNMQMRPDLSAGYQGRTYRFFMGSPIWEFGYGLSYSKFSHAIVEAPSTLTAPTLHQQLCHKDVSNSLKTVQCSKEDKDACEDLYFKVRVRVKNEGPMDGSHSVLLFSKSPLAGSNGTPFKQLVGFQRVQLESGSEEEVIFLVSFCIDLGSVKADGVQTLDIGTHTIIAGTAHHPIIIEAAHSDHEQS